MLKLAIAADHGGYELKEYIVNYLRSRRDVEVTDLGTDTDKQSVDYPDYAAKVAKAIQNGRAERGILLCGTGIGISITANKFKGIRAALCHDAYTARMSRAHNDANILAMGGRTTGKETAMDMVRIWLETEFEGGRHSRRVGKITELEQKEM
ncbi:MAG TPA: ribose 5-phosphate isomerase B [Caldithrix abyssi]|uniref:Ribose 5-phosphate isomerase B n=1 Tax=Caldithrix abyssi TaxID=187145 RepID=A0A7V4TXE5_CALAY|nr:ribose 5-phosphate isomerase B [Caldithrix abyssi]